MSTKNIIIELIRRIDNNIHPKRIRALLKYFNYFLITLGLIFVSIAIGVIGFMVIEDFSFIDALYMTIITVSTVGYGEVRELSDAGRLFVLFLIITNIGVFAYSVGNLANIIVDGEYRKIFKDLFIGRKIDKMKDHIIVCGFGRYGRSVIEHLESQGVQCVLIETETEKVDEIRKNHPTIIVLEGDATDEDTLLEAGAHHAKALITTLPVDADNVYVILSARQLNASLKIVSRANVAGSRKNMMRAGANQVLIPENIGGFYMSALVTKPDIIKVFTEISSTEKSSFRMAEVILDPLPARLLGRRLGDLNLESKSGVKVIGIKSAGGQFVVNPTFETPIQEKMGILVIGDEDQIMAFHNLTGEFDLIE